MQETSELLNGSNIIFKEYVLNPANNPSRVQDEKHWPIPSFCMEYRSTSPLSKKVKFSICYLHVEETSQRCVSHCSGCKLEQMDKWLYLAHLFWGLWSFARKPPASFRNPTLHFHSNQLCLQKMNRKESLIKTAAHGAFAVYRCQLVTSFKSLPRSACTGQPISAEGMSHAEPCIIYQLGLLDTAMTPEFTWTNVSILLA